MTRPLRPCLGNPGFPCGEPTRNPKGRCRPCQQRHDHNRQARDKDKRAAYDTSAYRKLRAAARRGQYGACVDCKSYDDLTIDHIIPLSQGGTNNLSNLVVRCRACNSRKHNRPGQETR